ncbi:hypothetical protein HID58_064848 [Brassica napus]|uniref:PGG domain-containing protein n=1 Tax=Brassica napus TaxID=3708 RepID=A0ABQ7ZB64_BRANA|nr:hypothetical protein HID58_064848 [Brassica napus]
MDPRLKQAAESGSIDELYTLIDENPYILENIDAVPFVTTPLHVAAASGNIPFAKEMLNLSPLLPESSTQKGIQAVRLLLECRLVKRNDVNGDGLTFLDILRRNQERREEAGGSQGPGEEEDLDLEQVVVNTGVSNTSDEARAVFLIVCTLIITATYQTALQPPGGVHQPEEDANAGSVVMKQTFFILLWVSNTVGFCYAILYTFCLMPIGSMFACWFFWIGGSLCISYALAMAVISPHPLVFISMTFAFFLLFALYLLSKIFFDNWRKHLTVGLVPQLSWRGKV